MITFYAVLLAIAFILSAGISAIVLPRIVKYSCEKNFFDIPDGERKVHTTPVPRLGGLSFLPVAVVVFAAVMLLPFRVNGASSAIIEEQITIHFLAYLVGAIMLYSVGIVDDIVGLSYRIKFLVQIVAAVSLCIGGIWISDLDGVFTFHRLSFWIGMPLSVLFVVYVTNGLNLIDGIDGLASGVSCMALIVIGVLSFIAANYTWALLCAVYLGTVSVFFLFNVYSKKYKIFMGDTGSLSLGFLLSFLIMSFWKHTTNGANIEGANIIALSTLVIPLFDVVRVFMSRIRDGRNPFLPDKNHIHHKLLRTGMGAKAVVASIILMTFCFIAVNYFVSLHCNLTWILFMDAALYVVMHIFINYFIHKMEKKTGIRHERKY